MWRYRPNASWRRRCHAWSKHTAERAAHAERQALAKEHAERRRLLNLVFHGADANIRALAGRGPRDEDLIARAHEAALELQRRWGGPK